MLIKFIAIVAFLFAIINGLLAQSLKPLPKDCTDPSIVKDGEYTIYPDGVIPVKVLCNVQGGGWTQIMNKVDRTVGPFKKTRTQYINGFGEPSSNFWMGLDSIRALVVSEPTMLRIELANGDYWIEYDSFYIGSEAEGYRLRVGSKIAGNLADAFINMNGHQFYTYEQENINTCGAVYNGGWWFTSCYYVCLTCEKSFVGSEGHWHNSPWLIVSNAKMYLKPKETAKPSNCYEIYKSGRNKNGIYRIYPDASLEDSVQVHCEMGLGGWTRIMTRNTNLNYSYLKDFEAYKTGFGNILTDHWIGLRNMRSILRKEQYQLRIELSNSSATDEFIVYDSFSVGSESDHFRLNLGPKILGELNDALINSNGFAFSTFDNDQDIWPGNCALTHRGGWWFRECYRACLTCSPLGIWSTEDSSANLYFINMKMLIRPKLL